MSISSSVFLLNDPATTEIYTLSLHDALPISAGCETSARWAATSPSRGTPRNGTYSPSKRAALPPRMAARSSTDSGRLRRSEEHTSELQSLTNLVCRLLLEKKNNTSSQHTHPT